MKTQNVIGSHICLIEGFPVAIAKTIHQGMPIGVRRNICFGEDNENARRSVVEALKKNIVERALFLTGAGE